MRGKLGFIERFVDPPRFEVNSVSAFASASGFGDVGDPIVIEFSGNTSPSVNRQVTLTAKVAGTWKFSITTAGSTQVAVDQNGFTMFSVLGSTGHGDYLPISVAVNDVFVLYDYLADYSDDVDASFWIE